MGIIMALPAHAGEPLLEELRACRIIADAEARSACYDKVVDRNEVSAAAGPERDADGPTGADEQDDTLYVPLNEDVGREALVGGTERREEIITGTVIGCRTDARGDTYFEFDNGQVWKEKTDSRVGFEDCNFDVTITKDFFGYKMQIVGEKRRIRISRHK